ncbi:MAG: aldolase/citrate lyase family protein [Planctomycetales bacterium]
MKRNLVKDLLQSGKTAIGSELTELRSGEVARIYAAAGFDFVFIDMEHSAFTIETVGELIRAARAVGIVPIVRVPQAEYVWVSRVLDNGAQGVIVPRVNTPQQARDIVSWAKYPPHGIRGYACTTAQTGGEAISPSEFIKHNNEQTLVVIQFERREAIENIEEMLSIPGIDVACMGCMDLSIDLGVPGDMDHPEMIAAMERVVEVSNRRKIASGIIAADMGLVSKWLERGMRFASYATDAIHLREAARSAAEKLRKVQPTGRTSCQS